MLFRRLLFTRASRELTILCLWLSAIMSLCLCYMVSVNYTYAAAAVML